MTVTITRNPNLTKTRQEKSFQNDIQKQFGISWWTGLAPEQCPGFDKTRQCLVALPFLNLEICSREDILDYFNNSWTLTELLFQGLNLLQYQNLLALYLLNNLLHTHQPICTLLLP